MIDPGKHFAIAIGVTRSSTMAAAAELFEHGHFASVVAVCAGALEDAPDDLELRTLFARALVALRQDDQAERQIGELLRRDANSSMGFQLLGELAYRRDDLASAEIFFRESWRLDASNASARVWLDVVLISNRSSGYLPSGCMHDESGRLVLPKVAARRQFAKGTEPQLRAMSSGPPRPRTDQRAGAPRANTGAPRAKADATRVGRMPPGKPPSVPDDTPLPSRFGGYLTSIGVLTREQLRDALTYHRQRRVRLGDAAVALGYVSRQKLDWAALGFHSRRRS